LRWNIQTENVDRESELEVDDDDDAPSCISWPRLSAELEGPDVSLPAALVAEVAVVVDGAADPESKTQWSTT
jgi:hypothetical protein